MAAVPDAPADARVVRVIPCNTPPPRFSVGDAAQLIAIATDRGYDVFTVDNSHEIHGYAYEFQGDQLVAAVENVVLSVAASPNGAIGGISLAPSASDSVEVMLAVTYGDPFPTGTALVPLDAELQPAGTPVMHDDWVGAYGSLARADSGGVVFLAQHITSGNELHARSILRSGMAAGPATQLDTLGLRPTEPTIMRAGTRYLIVWGSTNPATTARPEAKAELLDANLGIVATAATVSDPTKDANNPKAAYSEVAKAFLFAWFAKDATNKDVLGFSLRDEQLAEKWPVTTMFPEGIFPRLVAGSGDFLVAWTGAGATDLLDAARVRWDGSTPSYPGISNSTGKPYGSASDVVVREGQPVLIWLEKGSSTGNLALDPLCN
jgi:hypothetical protein